MALRRVHKAQALRIGWGRGGGGITPAAADRKRSASASLERWGLGCCIFGSAVGLRRLSLSVIRPEKTRLKMPTLSRFYGIVIYMNYNDHPPPHFHARYQDQEILVEIESGLVKGTMSRRALRMIFEWAERYQAELLQNWELARQRKPLEPIPPLS